MTAIYFTASSIDGFIADPANSLEWLLSRDVDVHGPMGYEGFLKNHVGALVMGSTTYEWLLEHQVNTEPPGAWPYEQLTWVFTTRDLPQASDKVRFAHGDVAAVYAQIADAAGERSVWVVGGGDLAGQFVDAGLLDEIWVQFAPVSLGAGAPLLPRQVELQLQEVVRNRDFACARYTIMTASRQDGRPAGDRDGVNRRS